MYKGLDIIFLAQGIAEMSVEEEMRQLAGYDIVGGVRWYQQVTYVYTSMVWLVVFSVKFAFLAFFWGLVSRVGGMVAYWRVVLGVCVGAFVFCVCAEFIECPYTSLRSCEFIYRLPHVR